jgi:uncharacterized protein (TIGR03067 family)
MIRPVPMAVVAWLLLVVPGVRADDQRDLKELAGTWNVVSFVMNGEKVPADNFKDLQLILKGDGTWKVTKAGEVLDEGTYTIDGTKMPKHLTSRSSKPGRKDEPAIFEVKEDVLLFCYSGTIDKRPTRFRSEKESNFGMIVAVRDNP